MSPADLALLRPWWLLALVPAAFVLWRLWRSPQAGAGAWSRVVDAHLAPLVLVGALPRGRRLGVLLLGAGMLVAILALAGPGCGQAPREGQRRDLARVLAVELSPAMEKSRLEQVKLKLLDLLETLPAGQTALLVYGGEPYLVVPPSADRATIALFIPELAVDAVPAAGNRPDRALAMAGEILARSGSRGREILWVTTGAAEMPAALPAGARLSILHAGQEADSSLAVAAERTGGAYALLQAGAGDLEKLSAPPARSGWVEDSRKGEGEKADGGYWLLPALLPLAALVFRKGVLMALLAPLFLAGFLSPRPAEAIEFSPPARLADYQAWKRFQAGDGEGALAGFADRRWKAAAAYRAGRFDQSAALLEGDRDPDSLYNRGNALARQGRLADALAAFEESLKLREDADARHNRDLVERLLKQQNQGGQGGGGQPPPPPLRPGQGTAGEREAAKLAEQWIRQVPDEPGSLLRRKLQAEHRRRQAGEGQRPW